MFSYGGGVVCVGYMWCSFCLYMFVCGVSDGDGFVLWWLWCSCPVWLWWLCFCLLCYYDCVALLLLLLYAFGCCISVATLVCCACVLVCVAFGLVMMTSGGF